MASEVKARMHSRAKWETDLLVSKAMLHQITSSLRRHHLFDFSVCMCLLT